MPAPTFTFPPTTFIEGFIGGWKTFWPMVGWFVGTLFGVLIAVGISVCIIWAFLKYVFFPVIEDIKRRQHG